MVDKNQAVIDYMIQCPQILNNPLFFNAINAKDNNKEIITVSTEKLLQKPYIDGSVLKRYTFTIIDFRSVTYQAVVKDSEHIHENVQELLDVQGIMDWIEEQNTVRHFPNFGENCTIDEIRTLNDSPSLNGIDASVSPNLAKYSISIQIDYMDNSKKIWS